MSQEADKFLHAEQSAQELLQTLEQLKKEATSYKTSANELDAVRQKLSGLIDSVLAVAKDTHEVVKLLKSIGGPEILSRIGGLSEQLNRMRLLAIIGLSVSALSVIGILVLLLR
ncbi:MAG: hypothetical protein ACKVRP_00395 [Bacteroidota bacterium]